MPDRFTFIGLPAMPDDTLARIPGSPGPWEIGETREVLPDVAEVLAHTPSFRKEADDVAPGADDVAAPAPDPEVVPEPAPTQIDGGAAAPAQE